MEVNFSVPRGRCDGTRARPTDSAHAGCGGVEQPIRMFVEDLKRATVARKKRRQLSRAPYVFARSRFEEPEDPD